MQNRKLTITIDTGTLAGQTFDLETGFLSVGRGETCSIRFDPLGERIASKQHAFIEARADGYYVTDNQSTNGTFLNGSPVASARLNGGDTIQFGKNGVTATVRIFDSYAAAIPDFREAQIDEFKHTAEGRDHSVQTSLVNFGLSNAAVVKPEPSKAGKYIGIGITLFAIAFMMLIVAALMFLSVGPGVAIVAAVIAFVPAIIYLFPILWLDRYDPEPLWLLGLAFAWGALVAVIVSFVINTIFGIAVGIAINPEVGEAAGAIMSAPIFEEASKGAGLLILLIF
ncbi:MAG: FHA domain-containing protein, partial [Blastocatellia bacterium]|nr:FHA domain-containing protein [Blastocatellia bacterium]